MEKIAHLPKIEGEPYIYQPFPAWCSGPNGENAVFENEGEVPAGWTLPDGKTKPGKTASAPVTGSTDNAGTTDEEELDADGWPWSADLHASTRTKTSAGLWRMKVGVTRPPAKNAAPGGEAASAPEGTAPALDL